MTDQDDERSGAEELPITLQIISGVGGLFLVVGIAMLGRARLDQGSWGGWDGPPACVTIVGVVILGGVALSWAVRGRPGG